MSLSEKLHEAFLKKNYFTLKDAYEAAPDKPQTTIRGRIYDNLGIKFEKVKRGLYRAIEKNNQCILIEGNGRELDFLENESVDLLLNDFPWEDTKSNKGGNRNFADYPCFKYTIDDFKEKARVLKQGHFLVEILPAENENNYEEIYRIKQLAKECGLLYYSCVPWIKGNFISNTGRKSKNSEMIMIFSKGKARSLRPDVKKSNLTGEECFMSGTAKMLPTAFNHEPVGKKDKIHTSEKPSSLIEDILEYLTLENEIVVDQYAGSGITGIGCLNKKRNCILIEYIKEFVDNIVERFKNSNLEVQILNNI